MKNILVPTDFSEYARFALNTALEIAHLHQSSILLFHCITDDMEGAERESQISLAKIKLQKELDALEAPYHRININMVVEPGSLITNVKNLIEVKEIDFVIMGSKGASGKKEFFIGSNAQKVIRNVEVPVLILKSPLKYSAIQNVLFASGFNVSDKTAFLLLLNMIKKDSATIHLLAINTSSFFSQPSIVMLEAMEDFAKLAPDHQIEKKFFSDVSIEAGIRHFSEEIGIDLIAISNHDKHHIKRFFQGSNVEMLVNHSNLAVLTLNHH